jgi:drug/metabolite transporter (DMT)-like permease
VKDDNSVRPLDAVGTAIIIAISFSWGLNQVSVKASLHDIPPLIQSTLRSIGAIGIILLWMRIRGIPMAVRDGTLAAGIAAGVLFGLEFLLIYRGLVWTTASRATLFIYTAPFVVALGSRWIGPGERLRLEQWFGLALSFAGLVVAFGVPDPAADRMTLVGDLMMVGAGVSWGATTLIIKATTLARAPAEKTLAYQLLVSIPMLAVGAWLIGERITHAPSAASIGWLVYQTCWIVCVTFAVWFAMIKRYSASRLSAFTFLTPLFGVASGHFLLGDPITPGFALAVVLVIAGLVLVNRPK